MPHPHDLLRVDAVEALVGNDAPAWVRDSLSTTPWVVVRRAQAPADSVAVGVRGPNRAQRHALVISLGCVEAAVAPEHLSQLNSSRACSAFGVLSKLRPVLNSTGLQWGPTGSVGFELATGAATVNDASDLDLVVRVDRLDDRAAAQLTALDHEIGGSDGRIDCQVELPVGAVALAELIGPQQEVLVRSIFGPKLLPREHAVYQ